jgi:HlyD family secretion protein
VKLRLPTLAYVAISVAALALITFALWAQLSHVLEDLAQAQGERNRVEQLFGQRLVPRQQVEQAQNSAITLEKEVEAARFRAKSAAAELRGAKAALTALGDEVHGEKALLTIRAPAAGRVLRISQASERVVTAGTPILVIGDLGHLEVVIEMLSSEAVKVTPGMPALLEGWGGDPALRARVRLVEPYAFTKVSALGVEEKRTNVILDFVDPPGALGDGFRVTGRIIVWSAPEVLKAPLSALFRCGSPWCVFVVDGKHARRREVRIGHYNSVEAEILSGLRANEQVVRHPPNELGDGSRISPRDRESEAR